jgi:putative serine protease PepD
MSTPTIDEPPVHNGHVAEAPQGRHPRRHGRAKRRRTIVAVGASALGALALTGLLFLVGAVGSSTTATSARSSGSTSTSTSTFNPGGIYTQASPGVVDITATGVRSNSTALPQSSTATGTGFTIDTRGDILTASHVVAGASKITVRLQDGTIRRATVAGVDPSTDVAVLKINPSGLVLHPLPLGSSASLSVGNPLAVIGDPFGYKRSLSTGVVSATDRTIQAPNGYSVAHAIQTDAAINPGNSGGPVLGAQGSVVGIVDQIAVGGTSAGSDTGVGFAIPIDTVKAELSQLESGTAVPHAYLGVSTAQATLREGALVQTIAPGSPAAAAGLRIGDLITAIDGTAVRGPTGIITAITAARPGQRVTLTVQRGSSSVTLTWTLSAQPMRAPTG